MEIRVKFRTDLHCNVAGLAYDFETRAGTLHMASNECCDMTGCIALFKRIDTGVKRINTIAGSNPDTIYIMEANGWQAYDGASNHA
jgi:hypothetical protein